MPTSAESASREAGGRRRDVVVTLGTSSAFCPPAILRLTGLRSRGTVPGDHDRGEDAMAGGSDEPSPAYQPEDELKDLAKIVTSMKKLRPSGRRWIRDFLDDEFPADEPVEAPK